MTDVSPATVERMIALVKRMSLVPDSMLKHASSGGKADVLEARAIATELPAPVDPDLVEAISLREAYANGELGTMQDAFKQAIKRGRTLATQGDR